MSKPASLAGMLMIGDAMAYALGPSAHTRVWRFHREPAWYRRMLGAVSDRRVGLAVALAELAAGVGMIMLARRLSREAR